MKTPVESREFRVFTAALSLHLFLIIDLLIALYILDDEVLCQKLPL